MKKVILIFLFSNLCAANDMLQGEFPGCPINASCSQSSGKKLLKWETLLKKISPKSTKLQIKSLQVFHKKHGLPIEFLSTQDSRISLDPILWSSRCRIHNPKNPHNSILKALRFLKSAKKSKHIVFTSVIVYDGTSKTSYRVPYQDQVLFIQNKKVVVLKDYDDFYYLLGVSPNGEYKVMDMTFKMASSLIDKKIKETKCPVSMDFDKKYFTRAYCQKVFDLDSNSLKTLQYSWSCP